MDIVVPAEYRYLYEVSEKRPITKIPSPILREKCPPVARVNTRIKNIAENMVRMMREANGIGLAAPQVGIRERIVVISPDDRPIVLINPEIIEFSEEKVVALEGCLSLPGLYGDVERSDFVVIKGLDKRGREVEFEMEGLAARVAQHEVDHLDGILFIDKADPATLHWELPPSEMDDA